MRSYNIYIYNLKALWDILPVYIYIIIFFFFQDKLIIVLYYIYISHSAMRYYIYIYTHSAMRYIYIYIYRIALWDIIYIYIYRIALCDIIFGSGQGLLAYSAIQKLNILKKKNHIFVLKESQCHNAMRSYIIIYIYIYIYNLKALWDILPVYIYIF